MIVQAIISTTGGPPLQFEPPGYHSNVARVGVGGEWTEFGRAELAEFLRAVVELIDPEGDAVRKQPEPRKALTPEVKLPTLAEGVEAVRRAWGFGGDEAVTPRINEDGTFEGHLGATETEPDEVSREHVLVLDYYNWDDGIWLTCSCGYRHHLSSSPTPLECSKAGEDHLDKVRSMFAGAAAEAREELEERDTAWDEVASMRKEDGQ